jgi:hypothetical protein
MFLIFIYLNNGLSSSDTELRRANTIRAVQVKAYVKAVCPNTSVITVVFYRKNTTSVILYIV